MLSIDQPLRRTAFELVRAEVAEEEVRTSASIGVQVELRHPSTGAPADYPSYGLCSFHLIDVARRDRPPSLRVHEQEDVGLHSERGGTLARRIARGFGNRVADNAAHFCLALGGHQDLSWWPEADIVDEQAELQVVHGRRACAGYPRAVTALRQRSP